MQERSPLRKNFKPLLEDALEILKDPFSNPDGDNYKMITYVVKNCDFFRQQFQSSVKLNQFANLSKDHLNYEVHQYGKVLFRENEISDKISIILKGDVQKYRQIPYKQIERKVNQRRMTLHVKSDLQTASTNNQTPTCPDVKTSRNILTNRSNLKVSFVDSQQEENKPKSKNFLAVPKIHVRPRRLSVESVSITTRFQSNPCSAIKKEFDLESIQTAPLKKIQSSGLNLTKNFSSIKTTESVEDRGASLCIDNEEPPENPNNLSSSSRCNMAKNDEDLLRFISFKDPQIKLRYFVEDILRADKIETLSIGDYFGENFIKQPTVKEKNMMVVSSDELHLLTLTLKGYKEILEEMEKQINEKFLFFINLFPNWDKDSVIRFSQLFIQQYFSKDDIIYSQDDNSQDLYIVQEGEVRLYKNMPSTQNLIVPRKSIIPVSPKASVTVGTPKSLAHLDFAPLFQSHRKIENNDLPVTSIVKKQFFGEEALLAKANRNYTAIANSHTVIAYTLTAEAYQRAKLTFGELLELLTRQAKNKLEWRKTKENKIVPISLTEPRNSIVATNPYAFPKTWVQSLENNTNKNMPSSRLKHQGSPEDEETPSVRNKTSEKRMMTEENVGRKKSIEIRFVTEESPPELRKLSVYTAAYRSPRSARIKTKGSVEESPTSLKKKSSVSSAKPQKDPKALSRNTSEKAKTSLMQQSAMLSKIVSHNNPLIERFSKKINEAKKLKFFPDVSSSQICASTTIVTNKSYEYATLHKIKKLGGNHSDLMMEINVDKLPKSIVVTSPRGEPSMSNLASPNKRVRLIKK